MNEVFSTRDMARLCGVNESTIKRWADSGRLHCIKTPGGHRKFLIRDVLTFLNEYGFEGLGVGGENPDGQADPSTTVRILRRDWGALSQKYLSVALESPPHEAVQFLFRCATGGCTLVEICDRIITPALIELGDRWAAGGLSVLEEHLVSAATVHGLERLAETMPRHDPLEARALCCPAEGERHEIGSRMTAMLLETLGWQVRSTMASTPMSDLVSWIQKHRPQLVCISMVTMPTDEAWRERFRALYTAARSCGTRLAIGGRGAAPPTTLPHDFLGQNLAGLEDFARSLTGRRSVLAAR